jgi:hypothetical protein
MEATTQQQLWLGFEDIAEQLNAAGDEVEGKKLAAVIENGYADSRGALFYQTTVKPDIPNTLLVVQGLEVGYRRFAVHGILYLDDDRTLCAAWTFTDIREAGEPEDMARCLKCLVDCSRSICRQGGIKATAIPHDHLRASIVAWIRHELQLPDSSEAPA